MASIAPATVSTTTTMALCPRRHSSPVRASYIAVFTYVRRHLHTTAHARSRSDFANQPFTGVYEPGQPTGGPLGEIPLIGRVGSTPRVLKQHLDQFVVGQNRAKKVMSTAVFNHYQRILERRRREDERQQLLQQQLRRQKGALHPVEDEYPGHHETVSRQTIPLADEVNEATGPDSLMLEKSNLLLLGPSGVGKTLMAKTLARVLQVPFSMSDCTPFTQAGYIGEDVQVCVERLLAAADYDVEAAEYGIVVLDEIDKIAAQKSAQGRDVGGEGVQQALLKLIEGTTVQIQVKPGATASSGSSRGNYGPDQTSSTSSMLGGRYATGVSSGSGGSGSGLAAKNEVFSVRTDNILFIFTGAFIGLHKHVMSRMQKGSIGFGSSIKSSNSLDTDAKETTVSVRPDSEEGKIFEKHMPFFKAQEDEDGDGRGGNSTTITKKKYNALDFVEPADLQAFGMIPELVGRVPVVTALSELDEDALVRVLTEPRNSLIKQYEQLFQLSGIELRFTSEALREIARTALTMTTGARALRTCVERLLSDAMFEAPGSSIKHVLITGKVARREEAPIYLARGQQHRFQSMLASEEDAFLGNGSSRRLRGGKNTTDDGSEPAAKTFEEYRARSTAAGYV